MNLMPENYELLNSFGGNSRSEVVLVRHFHLSMKRILKRTGKHPKATCLLRREAEILLSLKHPQIPEVYDYQEGPQGAYLLEEYIEGTSLQTYRSDHDHIRSDFICDIGIGICELFEYLHGQEDPILYLDLKPEHVLLHGENVALIDFGAACRKSSLAEGGILSGTEGYAAPELEAGGRVSEQTDIYELGILLQELRNPVARPAKMTEEDETDSLGYVIRKATARLPADRYTSISQMKQDLRELQTSKKSISIGNDASHRTQIAVVGSESHIGVTHVAIQFTTFLNEKSQNACYYAEDEKKALCRMEHFLGGASVKDGVVRFGKFVGDEIHRKEASKKDRIEVIDYGAFDPSRMRLYEEADLILLVAGAKPWEQENTAELVRAFRGRNQAYVLLNLSDRAFARALSRQLRITSASVPFHGDPYHLGEEIRHFYNAIWNMWKKG